MNTRLLSILLAVGIIALLALASRQEADKPAAQARATARAEAVAALEIPSRPEAIAFEPLAFEPPAAASFRRQLPDGTVVYLAPSR